MKKNKIDESKFTAKNNHISHLKEDVIKYANLLKPSIFKINDINKEFFEIKLKTNAIIKSFVILTFYNWQLADVINRFVFFPALYI